MNSGGGSVNIHDIHEDGSIDEGNVNGYDGEVINLCDLNIGRGEIVNDDNDENDENNATSANQYGRKRKRNEQTWKCNMRKAKRNSDLPYTTNKGKEVPGCTYRFVECSCRWKCAEKLPDNIRKEIHTQFWELNDWNIQTQYIVQNTMVCAIKQRKCANAETSHKQASRVTYLNGNKVCKQVFLSVTNKRYNHAVTKKRDYQTGVAEKDKRGYKSPPNKTPI